MNNQNIFISYCHANMNVVWKIADKLKNFDFPIWIDRYNLKGGDSQAIEISNGINNSILFIPFISDEYCNSEACRDEFGLAKKNRKKMLPVMLSRNVTNGIDLQISTLTTFYAFKSPNVFYPWTNSVSFVLYI